MEIIPIQLKELPLEKDGFPRFSLLFSNGKSLDLDWDEDDKVLSAYVCTYIESHVDLKPLAETLALIHFLWEFSEKNNIPYYEEIFISEADYHFHIEDKDKFIRSLESPDMGLVNSLSDNMF